VLNHSVFANPNKRVDIPQGATHRSDVSILLPRADNGLRVQASRVGRRAKSREHDTEGSAPSFHANSRRGGCV